MSKEGLKIFAWEQAIFNSKVLNFLFKHHLDIIIKVAEDGSEESCSWQILLFFSSFHSAFVYSWMLLHLLKMHF